MMNALIGDLSPFLGAEVLILDTERQLPRTAGTLCSLLKSSPEVCFSGQIAFVRVFYFWTRRAGLSLAREELA